MSVVWQMVWMIRKPAFYSFLRGGDQIGVDSCDSFPTAFYSDDGKCSSDYVRMKSNL